MTDQPTAGDALVEGYHNGTKYPQAVLDMANECCDLMEYQRHSGRVPSMDQFRDRIMPHYKSYVVGLTAELAELRAALNLQKQVASEAIDAYARVQDELAELRRKLAAEHREHLATQELHERSMRMIEEAIGATLALHDGWRAQKAANAIRSIAEQLAEAIDSRVERFNDATAVDEAALRGVFGNCGCDRYEGDYGASFYFNRDDDPSFAAHFSIRKRDGSVLVNQLATKIGCISGMEITSVGQLRHLLAGLGCEVTS